MASRNRSAHRGAMWALGLGSLAGGIEKGMDSRDAMQAKIAEREIERIKREQSDKEQADNFRLKVITAMQPQEFPDPNDPTGKRKITIRGVPQETIEQQLPGTLLVPELNLPDIPTVDPGAQGRPVSPPQDASVDPMDAKKRVSDNLKELSGLYGKLKQRGATVSTEATSGENIANRVVASKPGQVVSEFLGTEDQSTRNRINQLKPLLIQDIRQASKMGARGLDSEKELQFYLQAATDPTKDVQANLAALDVLDRAYGLGLGVGGMGATPINSSGTTANNVQVGQEYKGWIYLGGDKKNPQSWRKK